MADIQRGITIRAQKIKKGEGYGRYPGQERYNYAAWTPEAKKAYWAQKYGYAPAPSAAAPAIPDNLPFLLPEQTVYPVTPEQIINKFTQPKSANDFMYLAYAGNKPTLEDWLTLTDPLETAKMQYVYPVTPEQIIDKYTPEVGFKPAKPTYWQDTQRLIHHFLKDFGAGVDNPWTTTIGAAVAWLKELPQNRGKDASEWTYNDITDPFLDILAQLPSPELGEMIYPQTEGAMNALREYLWPSQLTGANIQTSAGELSLPVVQMPEMLGPPAPDMRYDYLKLLEKMGLRQDLMMYVMSLPVVTGSALVGSAVGSLFGTPGGPSGQSALGAAGATVTSVGMIYALTKGMELFGTPEGYAKMQAWGWKDPAIESYRKLFFGAMTVMNAPAELAEQMLGTEIVHREMVPNALRPLEPVATATLLYNTLKAGGWDAVKELLAQNKVSEAEYQKLKETGVLLPTWEHPNFFTVMWPEPEGGMYWKPPEQATSITYESMLGSTGLVLYPFVAVEKTLDWLNAKKLESSGFWNYVTKHMWLLPKTNPLTTPNWPAPGEVYYYGEDVYGQEGLQKAKLPNTLIGKQAIMTTINRLISTNEPYEKVVGEVVDMMGLPGQMGDFVGQTALDPLNWVPGAERASAKAIGYWKNDLALVKAANVTNGGIVSLIRAYENIIPTIPSDQLKPWHYFWGDIRVLDDGTLVKKSMPMPAVYAGTQSGTSKFFDLTPGAKASMLIKSLIPALATTLKYGQEAFPELGPTERLAKMLNIIATKAAPQEAYALGDWMKTAEFGTLNLWARQLASDIAKMVEPARAMDDQVRMIERIAYLVGMEPNALLKAIQGKGDDAKIVFEFLKEKLSASETGTQMLNDPNFTIGKVGDMMKIMDEVNWHPEKIAADVLNKATDKLWKSISKDLGVKPDNAFSVFLKVSKQALTLHALALNPSYLFLQFTDTIGNYAWVVGAGPTTSGKMNNYNARIGMQPPRFGEAYGMLGTAGEVPKTGVIGKVLGKFKKAKDVPMELQSQAEMIAGGDRVLRKAMISDKAATQKLLDGMEAVTNTLGVATRLSRGIESYFSKLAQHQMMKRGRANVYSGKLSSAAIDVLKRYGMDVDAVQGMVRKGLNGDEINTAIFGLREGELDRVGSYLDGAAQRFGEDVTSYVDMLDHFDLQEKIDGLIAKGTPRIDAVDIVSKDLLYRIGKSIEREKQNMISEAGARSRASGILDSIGDVLTDIDEQIQLLQMSTEMDWGQTIETSNALVGKDKDNVIRAMFKRADQMWKNKKTTIESDTTGKLLSLGFGDANDPTRLSPLASALSGAISEKIHALDEFYRMRERLWNDVKNDKLTWADYHRILLEDYLKFTADEITGVQNMRKSTLAMWEKRFGKAGLSLLGEYFDNLERLTDLRRRTVADFRRAMMGDFNPANYLTIDVEDQKFNIFNLVNGKTPDQVRGLWKQYWDTVYNPLVYEGIQFRSRLNIQIEEALRADPNILRNPPGPGVTDLTSAVPLEEGAARANVDGAIAAQTNASNASDIIDLATDPKKPKKKMHPAAQTLIDADIAGNIYEADKILNYIRDAVAEVNRQSGQQLPRIGSGEDLKNLGVLYRKLRDTGLSPQEAAVEVVNYWRGVNNEMARGVYDVDLERLDTYTRMLAEEPIPIEQASEVVIGIVEGGTSAMVEQTPSGLQLTPAATQGLGQGIQVRYLRQDPNLSKYNVDGYDIIGISFVDGKFAAWVPLELGYLKARMVGGEIQHFLGVDGLGNWVFAKESGEIFKNSMKTPDGELWGPLVPGAFEAMGATPLFMGQAMDDAYAMQLLPVLNEIKHQMGTRSPGLGDLSKMTDADRKILVREANRLTGEVSKANLASIHLGEAARDLMLLNYGARTGFDTAMLLFMPYQFFQTRSLLKWGLLSLDRPAMSSTLIRFIKLMSYNSDEETDIQARNKGEWQIPVPWLEEWAGGSIFADPVMNVLFPMTQVMRPYAWYANNQIRMQENTKRVLYEWATGDVYPLDQITEAAASMSGPLWEKARAMAEAESSDGGLLELMSLVSTPAPWVMSVLAPIMNNKSPAEAIRRPFPLSRMIQSLAAFTGNEAIGSLDWQAQIQKKVGIDLPYGAFSEFYIWRAGITMIDDTDYNVRDIMIAMLEGPKATGIHAEIYQEVLRRTAYWEGIRGGFGFMEALGQLPEVLRGEMGVSDYIGSVLLGFIPADIVPTAELKRRGLYDEWVQAINEQNTGVNKNAVREFLDNYPEYEYYLEMKKDPEERMQSFIVGEFWDRWYTMSELEQKEFQDQLNDPLFDYALMNKGTRDYDAISIEKLASWTKAIGGYIPRGGPEVEAVPYARPEADLSAQYNQLLQTRTDVYPDINQYYNEIGGYYSQSAVGPQELYLQNTPAYQAARDKRTKAIEQYVIPVIGEEYWDMVAELSAIEGNLRSELLSRYPILEEGWEWTKQQEEARITPLYKDVDWRAMLHEYWVQDKAGRKAYGKANPDIYDIQKLYYAIRDERNEKFKNFDFYQDLYYSLPEDARTKAKAADPRWATVDAILKEHEQEWLSIDPNWEEHNELYYSLSPSPRKMYLENTPNLQEYWNSRSDLIARYPDLEKYLETKEQEERADFSQEIIGSLDSTIVRELVFYYDAGIDIDPVHEKYLRQKWEQQGKPYDDFWEWLDAMKWVFKP